MLFLIVPAATGTQDNGGPRPERKADRTQCSDNGVGDAGGITRLRCAESTTPEQLDASEGFAAEGFS